MKANVAELLAKSIIQEAEGPTPGSGQSLWAPSPVVKFALCRHAEGKRDDHPKMPPTANN